MSHAVNNFKNIPMSLAYHYQGKCAIKWQTVTPTLWQKNCMQPLVSRNVWTLVIITEIWNYISNRTTSCHSGVLWIYWRILQPWLYSTPVEYNSLQQHLKLLISHRVRSVTIQGTKYAIGYVLVPYIEDDDLPVFRTL